MPKPFVKWVGGKRQLVPELLGLFPEQAGTYFEPFVGGGAVYWAMAEQGRFQAAVLNDFNEELVNCYRVVRDFPDELIDQLSKLVIDKEVYMQLRAALPESFFPVRRAARTIYLNKLGFNGLYRVNKSGAFNVPWGSYKNPKIYDEDNLRSCAETLNRATSLRSGDFAAAVTDAKAGDLVYFDPPYVELSATSNFKSYTSGGFSLDDQYRLAACFRELAERGVTAVTSNSSAELVREIYEGWETHEVQARRSVNSRGDKRGPITELIMINRKV